MDAENERASLSRERERVGERAVRCGCPDAKDGLVPLSRLRERVG
jgi:hypothetical protein